MGSSMVDIKACLTGAGRTNPTGQRPGSDSSMIVCCSSISVAPIDEDNNIDMVRLPLYIYIYMLYRGKETIHCETELIIY